MEVVVPAGVSSGELISFQALDGTLMEVAVPDGVAAGDAFIVDVGLESMTLSDSPQQHAPAAHQVEGDAAGRELVLALVEHSARIIAIDMAWFFEAHCHLFEQSEHELSSGAGETLEQYEAFQRYERELELHFESFVHAHGFASAADCFAAIDAALVADMASQQRQRERLEARLRKVQKESRQAAEELASSSSAETGGGLPSFFGGGSGGGLDDHGACMHGALEADSDDGWSDDGDDDDDAALTDAMMPLLGIGGIGGIGGVAAAEGEDQQAMEPHGTLESGDSADIGGGGVIAPRPLTLFSQEVALDDLISEALSLGEYVTFSSVMRKKAAEVASRRRWLASEGARHEASAARRKELDDVLASASASSAASSHSSALDTAAAASPEHLSRAWAGLGQRLLALAAPGSDPQTGGGAAQQLRGSAAAQSAEETRLLAKFGAAGTEPPTSAHEKRELYLLLGSPLSRLAMLCPSMSTSVTAQLRKLQAAIAASTKLGEQRGCVEIIVDGAKAAHALMDAAEAAIDASMRVAERQAEVLRWPHSR